MIPRDLFKKIFFRFCKEHGVYSFMIGEIKKEHKTFDRFYTIVSCEGLSQVFNKTAILSFPWADKLEFWHIIHTEWMKTYSEAFHLYSNI